MVRVLIRMAANALKMAHASALDRLERLKKPIKEKYEVVLAEHGVIQTLKGDRIEGKIALIDDGESFLVRVSDGKIVYLVRLHEVQWIELAPSKN